MPLYRVNGLSSYFSGPGWDEAAITVGLSVIIAGILFLITYAITDIGD